MNRHPVCGSLAHADLAAELPELTLMLDTELVPTGPNGVRSIPAQDIFVTMLTTSLGASESLAEARFAISNRGAAGASAS